MRPSSIKRRVALAGSVGVTALIATLGLGASVASAVPADPPGGATPTAPSFNNGIVNAIRGTGSDTTIFMMQKISDLYTQAGLYGCTLNSSTGQALYNSSLSTSTSNLWYYCRSSQNTTTTDTADNWSRTEVSQGVDDVGSSAGQKQLCGSGVLTSPLPVDFARSSKPQGGYCSDLKQAGYAKDSVPGFDYQINPATIGTVGSSSPYATVNGGSIGPVTLGWLPGDPTSGP
jgi:ABC-type phosphate transport system substrate-binding protein